MVSPLVYIHNHRRRIVADVGVIYGAVTDAARMVPCAVIGVIMWIPIVVVSIIIMVVMRRPGVPV